MLNMFYMFFLPFFLHILYSILRFYTFASNLAIMALTAACTPLAFLPL